MKKRHHIYIVSIALVALFSSCTVTQELTLNNNKGGSLASEINIENFFIDVIEDFSQFLPENNDSIMDSAVSTFSAQLKDSKQASKVNFIKTGENSYFGTFDFNSLTSLIGAMNSGKTQSVFKQTDNSLSFYVDINNYTELEEIVPFLADPNIEVYLAKYNEGYTEEDYLDMIVFSLGEEAPEALTKSVITMNVNVPGTLTKVEGAKKLTSNSFSFTFRLIDFLLLSKPLSFEVEWK